MPVSRLSGVDVRQPRRWAFADCVFNEANWTLVVHGRRVAIETKPLEMLRELLLHAGDVVSKDELLDRIWPDVTVVEASLTTAVRKLRLALGDDKRQRGIIETASGIGYRVAVPVTVEDFPPATAGEAAPEVPGPPVAAPANRPAVADAGPRVPVLLTILLIALGAMAVALPFSERAPAAKAPPAFTQQDAVVAIREMDVDAVKRLIAAGWDPTRPWDAEGNDAFTMVLNHCEWDRAHDRRQMLLMARTLLEAGVRIDRRNVWGDTPYSIAKAPRYCGPDHPVTQMLEAMCYGNDVGPKDRCLATYELTAAQRKAQGLPPKG